MIATARGGRAPAYTDEERAIIAGARSRADLVEIAVRIGRTFDTVCRQALRQGMRFAESVDWAERRARVAELHRRGMTQDAIAAEMQLSRSAVARTLRKLGIAATRKEAPKPLTAERAAAVMRAAIQAEAAARVAAASAYKVRTGGGRITQEVDRLGFHAPAESAPAPTLADLSGECVRLYRKAWADIRTPGKASDREYLWGAMPTPERNGKWIAAYKVGKQSRYVGTYPTEKAAHEAAVKHRNAKHGAAA